MKLAWEILNVFAMYQMGFWWVLYPFPCNVLAVYLLGTLALAPSEYWRDLPCRSYEAGVRRTVGH